MSTCHQIQSRLGKQRTRLQALVARRDARAAAPARGRRKAPPPDPTPATPAAILARVRPGDETRETIAEALQAAGYRVFVDRNERNPELPARPFVLIDTGLTNTSIALLYVVPDRTIVDPDFREQANAATAPVVQLLKQWGIPVRMRRGGGGQADAVQVFPRPAAPSQAPAAERPAWSGRADFEERKTDRIDRLRAGAGRLSREADALAERSRSMLPDFGQPILVGHHSEKGYRRLLQRSDSAMRRSIERDEQAAILRGAAHAAERNRAISSDDPEALIKLRTKLAELEALQDHMKRINRAVRAKDPRRALAELGVSEAEALRLLKPDHLGRRGHPDYELQNNGARIRDVRARIAEMERARTQEAPAEHQAGTIRIRWDTDDNRVVVETRPRSPEERKKYSEAMRGRGFVFAKSIGAWVRKATPDAWRAALRLAEQLSGEAPRPSEEGA